MPYYSYRCNECGTPEDHFRKMEQRDSLPFHCHKEMERIFSPVHIRGDIQPYRSPIDGTWIESRRQRDEILAREGCIINEPGVKQDIERRSIELKSEVTRAAEKTIDQTVSELHAAGHI